MRVISSGQLKSILANRPPSQNSGPNEASMAILY